MENTDNSEKFNSLMTKLRKTEILLDTYKSKYKTDALNRINKNHKANSSKQVLMSMTNNKPEQTSNPNQMNCT